jgi:methylaspartate ammonia-lyase
MSFQVFAVIFAAFALAFAVLALAYNLRHIFTELNGYAQGGSIKPPDIGPPSEWVDATTYKDTERRFAHISDIQGSTCSESDIVARQEASSSQ